MLKLYSIQFLHQITTIPVLRVRKLELYSIQFLHQITTTSYLLIVSLQLYSIQFLHQITTDGVVDVIPGSLYSIQCLHQITTARSYQKTIPMLYSIQFLHQITTAPRDRTVTHKLYSIQFLHQITTSGTTLIDYKGITSVCAAKKAMFGELRKSIRCSFSVLQNKYIKKIPVVEVFRDRRVRPLPQKFKISPYCLSVTLRMLVIPEGGIDLRTCRIWTSIFSLETQCRT